MTRYNESDDVRFDTNGDDLIAVANVRKRQQKPPEEPKVKAEAASIPPEKQDA